MRRAFTLIELSISMLILSLLISGVLVANKMQQSAKLSRLMREVKQLEQAIIDFKVQYNAMPGSYNMHKQLNAYPELGGSTLYADIINSTYQPFWETDPNAISMHNRVMTANSMLQMKMSSGGVYPNIKSNNTTSSSADNFMPIDFGNNSILLASYVSTKNSLFSVANSTITGVASCIYSSCPSKNAIHNNILSFVDTHNIYLMKWDLSSSVSVSDAVKISKKFDIGRPNGNKINFGAERNNYNRCTTATAATFGSGAQNIGPDTQFLNNANYSNVLMGCIVAFKTNIDNM